MSKQKIAITGGIGSGKSTVRLIISALGYKTFDADKIYAELLKDEKIAEKISNSIGVPLKTENGKNIFDRKAVAETVFHDREKLKTLSAVAHEYVFEEINRIYEDSAGDKAVFFEVPILFEVGRVGEFDKVIVVKRAVDKRIESVVGRDGLTEKDIELRIKNQFDYDNLNDKRHTFIYNDGDLKSLEAEVKSIVDSLEK